MDCLMSFRWADVSEQSCRSQRTLGMEAIVDLRFKDFSNVCLLYFSYCVPKQLVEVICKNAQNPKTATPTAKPKNKKLRWEENRNPVQGIKSRDLTKTAADRTTSKCHMWVEQKRNMENGNIILKSSYLSI